jgi:hypothetical protein
VWCEVAALAELAAVLHELDLIAIEREERRKAQARRIAKHVRLGVASADELRLLGPVARIGKVE